MQYGEFKQGTDAYKDIIIQKVIISSRDMQQRRNNTLPLDPTQLGKFLMTGWNNFEKTIISSGGNTQKHNLWLSRTGEV